MLFNYIDGILEVLVDVAVQGHLAQVDTGTKSFISPPKNYKKTFYKLIYSEIRKEIKNTRLCDAKIFIFIFQKTANKSSILTTHHPVCLSVSLT